MADQSDVSSNLDDPSRNQKLDAEDTIQKRLEDSLLGVKELSPEA
jgi:hypothetical protein